MFQTILLKHATLAELEAACGRGELLEREPYYISDYGWFAVGVSSSVYSTNERFTPDAANDGGQIPIEQPTPCTYKIDGGPVQPISSCYTLDGGNPFLPDFLPGS